MQLRKCPACGAGGSATINEDAFGAFKVVVDANNNRKVAREGSKFLYDDAADSLIRMLWPERVQEYVSADVDRERALLLILLLIFIIKQQTYRASAVSPAAKKQIYTHRFEHLACRTTA